MHCEMNYENMSEFKLKFLPRINCLHNPFFFLFFLATCSPVHVYKPHFHGSGDCLQKSFVCVPPGPFESFFQYPSKDRLFRAQPPRLAKNLAPRSLELPLDDTV